ncbi:DUF1993 domain-containing protein [Chelativorans sp. AA-79]|uniref:DUF1993 domain-containing protein n=1 Tax=Chelativorans sp. AA-79 TaxID=3028735 RepID=UPI0023F982FE|nr:DUF1993 domain-containing protein [Chelativorans sp. AA-79]WEX09413.1 DUF1993 domain-containing protein [Chelativorans sp. AA-79]
MPLSLYEVSIPVFIRTFGHFSKFLDKGRAFADEKGIPHSALLEARLYPDMAPLTAQVQRASDTARFAPIRVAQVEAVSMPDTETSFEELQARIAKTVDFLKTVPPHAIDAGEETEVTLKTQLFSMTFTGKDYLLGFAMPNFYFHVTTAYGILRHQGVPLGKLDFFGRG